ncbi:hypothetical protein SHKM778_24030 [Streptomyces sp. KM77-8]|uniref:Uncharacterized protein n=1 Tax=Streptomyces haneummycinicus TaxID=3074435 RepID=A0AAT9HFC1_9ACTN
MLAAVALEVRVDPVRHPEQRQLPEGGEVAGAEVVGEGGVDLVRLVDVAVRHAAAQRLGGHVDEFDLLGPPYDLVRYGVPLPYAGDRLHYVAQRLQVLDVDGGEHVDAGGEEFLHVLPASGVAGAGGVGVGELVDQRDLGAAGEDGVEVHLPVLGLPRRHLFEPVQQGLRTGRPCGSAKATTQSVPRPARRWASESIAYVLPTPGAAPR